MTPASSSRNESAARIGKCLILPGLILLVSGWLAPLPPDLRLPLSIAACAILACGYLLIRRPEYLVLVLP